MKDNKKMMGIPRGIKYSINSNVDQEDPEVIEQKETFNQTLESLISKIPDRDMGRFTSSRFKFSGENYPKSINTFKRLMMDVIMDMENKIDDITVTDKISCRDELLDLFAIFVSCYPHFLKIDNE